MPKIAAGATNKNISLAPNGTGKVVVGTGAADATVQSDGDHNLILQTGNSTTSKIELNDGANGDVAVTPNGTGNLTIDNIAISDNTIKSTDTNGNIDLTPDGTGEVNISKVDIDSGAIDGTTIATSDVTVGSGKTLDVSAGSLTTSTAQKQAIVDGADIEGTDILSTGESGSTKFLRENGSSPASWEAVGSASLPYQAGNADRLLTTDATDASWTNAPSNLVKVAFAAQTNAPAAPSAGTIYYSNTTNTMWLWNGTVFVPLYGGALGGVITGYTTGGVTYSVHTFLTSGTFEVKSAITVDYLVVGGGGSGGRVAAGGGGAGGVRTAASLSVPIGSYTVVIGDGGAAQSGAGSAGNDGTDSSIAFSVTITATGGGGGAGGSGGATGADARDGGSGGGGATTKPLGAAQYGGDGINDGGTFGSATFQGYDGGDVTATEGDYVGAGAGGAGAVGANTPNNTTPTAGGDGTKVVMGMSDANSTLLLAAASAGVVDGSFRYIGGGGGGATDGSSTAATGGKGGGGSGGRGAAAAPTAGVANTGGGSGGSAAGTATSLVGGSGIVIIRYAI